MSATKQYDVFISYARKDMKAADSLCRALDEAGVSYFIDRRMHASVNFMTEITNHIKRCRALLFIASENSARSTFTQKEILYALKYNKEIVPYRIGDFQFEECAELEFFFMNVQWQESEAEIVASLDALGLVPKKSAKTEEVTTPQRFAVPRWVWGALAGLVVLVGGFFVWQSMGYKVGDYYDDGTKQGIVFELDWTHRHGKIVGLFEADDRLAWCSDEQAAAEIVTGTLDHRNGWSNQQKIMQIAGWREKYPAFAWCADQGEGWYLPAVEELETLLLDEEVFRAVKSEFERRSGLVFYESSFWSSTTPDTTAEFTAWYVSRYVGSRNYGAKIYYNDVRAVAAF